MLEPFHLQPFKYFLMIIPQVTQPLLLLKNNSTKNFHSNAAETPWIEVYGKLLQNYLYLFGIFLK